ncbi:hypothetical protein [Stigmatella aurantiaca]|uniref:Uncharacterized protein n=1 Tax=Stigmatella aurantiaca (strain DW4/3-1) TaxID=378806 RepID=Q093U9_STIAD|nr:hypothetical protein [Stigmatella aurantiaca]EAU67021.1 hypothetical protein STIAU_3531 [Stigmatella aurantiaca DW4/3-1]
MQECPGDCNSLGGNESCEAHGHKNVIFRSIPGAPSKRASFLDPLTWNATAAECVGLNPSPYCHYASYTAWARTNALLWTWLRANGYRPPAAGQPASALTLIHTPGNIHHNDWASTDPDFVRNVESFSQWGNSEGAAPRPAGRARTWTCPCPAMP